jgi:hypothetical protein
LQTQRLSSSVDLLILNVGARWGWVVNATPRPPYVPYSLGRKHVILRAGLDRYGEEKILSPLGYEPRVVQLVASLLLLLHYCGPRCIGEDTYRRKSKFD